MLARTALIFFCFLATLAKANSDSLDFYLINKITIVGNDRTDEFVLLRELTFHEGDTIDKYNISKELDQSRQNLLNLSLFNFVEIQHVPVTNDITEIYISVTERWYFWPLPILEFADPNFNVWWENRDFRRLNWGVFAVDQNFRGRRETLGLIFQLGYSNRFGLMYDMPVSKKNSKVGGGAYAAYKQTSEIAVNSSDNRRILVRQSGKTREEYQGSIYLKIRNSLYFSTQLLLDYTLVQVQDSIHLKYENYLGEGRNSLGFVNVAATFKYDLRDRKYYPLKGSFYRLDLIQKGFGLFSDLNVTRVETEAKKFIELNDDLFWALGFRGAFTFQKDQPYYFQEALGYDAFVRGYERYVVDGEGFGLLKTNVKYKLLSSEKKEIPLVKRRDFKDFHYALYLNAFADLGYVVDQFGYTNNLYANNWINGVGIGIDFVTYYDKVIRMEVSRASTGNVGFFLHFRQPI